MATVGAYDRQKFLDELNYPLQTNKGMLSPSTQKATAVTNLGFTSTAAAISAAGAAASSIVSVPDAATYTVLAADTGKVHVLPNFTANCTITLPTAAAGLQYEFVGKAVAADAQNWIFAAGVPYIGGLTHADLNSGTGADEIVAVFPNGSSNDNMTVATPSAGTYVRLICDGTNWIVNGVVNSDTAPSFAD